MCRHHGCRLWIYWSKVWSLNHAIVKCTHHYTKSDIPLWGSCLPKKRQCDIGMSLVMSDLCTFFYMVFYTVRPFTRWAGWHNLIPRTANWQPASHKSRVVHYPTEDVSNPVMPHRVSSLWRQSIGSMRPSHSRTKSTSLTLVLQLGCGAGSARWFGVTCPCLYVLPLHCPSMAKAQGSH